MEIFKSISTKELLALSPEERSAYYKKALKNAKKPEDMYVYSGREYKRDGCATERFSITTDINNSFISGRKRRNEVYKMFFSP